MTIRETKSQIAKVLNDSGLAIDVIEVILESFLAEVHLATDRAYAEELAKRQEEAQKEESADESDESKLR